MAKVYADLIRKGIKTIDDVPDKLKAAVQALLEGKWFDRTECLPTLGVTSERGVRLNIHPCDKASRQKGVSAP